MNLMLSLLLASIATLCAAQDMCSSDSDCAMSMDGPYCCLVSMTNSMLDASCVSEATAIAESCQYSGSGGASMDSSAPTPDPMNSMDSSAPTPDPMNSMDSSAPTPDPMNSMDSPTGSMGSLPTPFPTPAPSMGSSPTPSPTLITSCTNKCNFDGKDWFDCLVYGSLDGNLIAWKRAPQSCLDAFNIKDEAVDPMLLSSMFPTSDGVGGDVNAFVNYLRFDTNTVTYGFRASFPDFFEDTGMGGVVEMKSSVTYDMTTEDCTMGVSACWALFKKYLTFDPTGIRGMEEIGSALYAKQAQSRELEQSLIRIRLCNIERGVDFGYSDAVNYCSELFNEVIQVQFDHSGRACSAFGLGPGTKCGDASSMGSTSSTSGSSSTTGMGDESLNPESGITGAAVTIGVVAIIIIVIAIVCWGKNK